jgi:hypothetical protein
MGKALGETKTLQRFTINGCNLNEGDNCETLFDGLNLNETLEKIDLSDN